MPAARAGVRVPPRAMFNGPLAQLVEQLTLNQLVVGSIPTRPTNFSNLHAIHILTFYHSTGSLTAQK